MSPNLLIFPHPHPFEVEPCLRELTVWLLSEVRCHTSELGPQDDDGEEELIQLQLLISYPGRGNLTEKLPTSDWHMGMSVDAFS